MPSAGDETLPLPLAFARLSPVLKRRVLGSSTNKYKASPPRTHGRLWAAAEVDWSQVGGSYGQVQSGSDVHEPGQDRTGLGGTPYSCTPAPARLPRTLPPRRSRL